MLRTIFLLVVATACFYAVAAIRLLARLRRRHPRGRLVNALDVTLFVVAGVGLLLYAYGRWIEPRRVEIRSVVLRTPALPREAAPIRIVLFSDVHTPSNMALQRRLPGLIDSLRPDVVAFAGDAVNSADAVEAFNETLARIARVAPTFVVRGNNDLARGALPLFRGTGAIELRGNTHVLIVRGTRLAFVGSSTRQEWRQVRGSVRRARENGLPVVYLAHSPDYAPELAGWGANLYLAGHTHGGQVALPGYGAIVTASRFGKRFESGAAQAGEMHVYVTRGIGMNPLPPGIRLFARPEITLIELAGA